MVIYLVMYSIHQFITAFVKKANYRQHCKLLECLYKLRPGLYGTIGLAIVKFEHYHKSREA